MTANSSLTADTYISPALRRWLLPLALGLSGSLTQRVVTEIEWQCGGGRGQLVERRA